MLNQGRNEIGSSKPEHYHKVGKIAYISDLKKHNMQKEANSVTSEIMSRIAKSEPGTL